jgi:hypothetical protein
MTARMLAQRQPSFKECVTAHWSSDFAPKMNGAQAYNRNRGIVIASAISIGRGAYCLTMKVYRKEHWRGQ